MGLGRRDFIKRAGAGAALLAGGSGVLQGTAFATVPPRAPEKSNVSFIGSSSEGTRRKMILDVLEPWRSTVAAGIAGKTVLIKPNLVTWYAGIADPTLGLTHVDAVRGLIDFIRSISATIPIVIGEIPGTTQASTTTIMTKANYDPLTSEYSGVTLMDLGDTAKMPSVDRQFWTPDFSASATATIPVTSAFIDPSYYVISICRPKSHNCMVMTGINKNILMAAPLNAPANVSGGGSIAAINPKQFMHGKNGWSSGQHTDENKCLAYNLFQMANIIYPTGAPALSVLDSWEGMEGEGPVAGRSVMQYCAVAGTDPLAVDRLSAKLMGFSDTPTDPMDKNTPSYTDMRALVWISNAGLGNYDLGKINFIAGSLSGLEQYVKTYKLHTNYTGTASYATNWTGGPPSSILSSAIGESRDMDPKPFLIPQVNKTEKRGEIAITFALPVTFNVRLGIYNLEGAEVRRLGDAFLSPGRYAVSWNGCDNRGERVPAGSYIIKLKFGSRSMCDRVVIRR